MKNINMYEYVTTIQDKYKYSSSRLTIDKCIYIYILRELLIYCDIEK